MIKYCLPIIKKSKEEVLNYILENSDYTFYEIWLSYIEDLDTDFIWKISNLYNGKLIFLFRKQNLEKSNLDQEFKEKIIKLLENSDNLLDFDVQESSWGLKYIKENKLQNKTIASFHNYKSTPDLADLYKKITLMESYSPDIFKVSTFCKSSDDSLNLLTLLLRLKKEHKKFIVLGMGDEGMMVRIYGALWGNELNFAPVTENEKSAPGQLTKQKLERILEVITQ